jgi:hypothetical protein
MKQAAGGNLDLSKFGKIFSPFALWNLRTVSPEDISPIVDQFLMEEYSVFVQGNFNAVQDSEMIESNELVVGDKPNFIDLFFGSLVNVDFLGDKKVWSESSVILNHKLKDR